MYSNAVEKSVGDKPSGEKKNQLRARGNSPSR